MADNINNFYIDKKEIYKQIVISKAYGFLTRDAEEMLKKIADRAIRKMVYSNPDDRKDCIQTGLLNLFDNWSKFNEEKYTDAFSYYTEIFKRGIAAGYNELHKKKGDPDNLIRLMSLDRANDGEGLHHL
jgi:hypothetical protein